MFILSSYYGTTTPNASLSEIMVVLWCNQTENGAGVEAPFTTSPQISWFYCRETGALCLDPSTAQIMYLNPELLYCLLLKHGRAGRHPLLVCKSHQFVSISACSVVIIMCGSPENVSSDLGTEKVDNDIVIILIDPFK